MSSSRHTPETTERRTSAPISTSDQNALLCAAGQQKHLLQAVTNRKAAFPNAAAMMKALYLRTLDIMAKWVMPYPNWGIIRGKLDLLWGIGWDA